MMHPSNRSLGVWLIVIAVVLGAWTVYSQWQDTRFISCQTDFNEATNAVQRQRASWADEDRKALNTMIFTVVQVQNQRVRKQAVDNYVDTVRDNDHNRRANPLPTRPDCS
jgi:hypothetical protein